MSRKRSKGEESGSGPDVTPVSAHSENEFRPIFWRNVVIAEREALQLLLWGKDVGRRGEEMEAGVSLTNAGSGVDVEDLA